MAGTEIALGFLRRSTEGRRRLTAAVFSIAILFGASGAPAQAPPLAVVEPGEAAVTGFSGAVPPSLIAPGEDPATENFHRFAWTLVPNHRPPSPGRPTGRPGCRRAEAVHRSSVADRPGLRRRARRRSRAECLCRRHLRIRPAHRRAPPGRNGATREDRRAESRFHARPLGSRRRAGSIYKIDGRTGRVSHFESVTTDGRPNSGAALGALAFDRNSKTLFVADRESGLIQRFSIAGKHLGVYDHGATGRAAQGLPPSCGHPVGRSTSRTRVSTARIPPPGTTPHQGAACSLSPCTTTNSTTRSPTVCRFGRSASGPMGL